jgi:hypothetical protein
VGGPDIEDTFIDSIKNSENTKVAIDFNAGLIGDLASLLHNSE